MSVEQSNVIFCPHCGASNSPSFTICTRCQGRLPSRSGPKITREEERPSIEELITAGQKAGLVEETEINKTRQDILKLRDSMAEDLTEEHRMVQPASKSVELTAASDDSHHDLPAPSEAERIPDDARRLRFGYSEDNDIVVPQNAISRHHAVLAYSPSTGAYYFKDLNSTNGISINGRNVQCAIARPGDVLGLGSYAFKLDKELTRRLTDLAVDARPTQAMDAIRAPSGPEIVIIGRDPEADIILDAPQISRQHVRLTRTEYGWLVEDLGSANGTFLNERHSQQIDKVEAKEQDVIYMGSYRFPLSRLRDFLGNKDDMTSSGKLAMPLDKKIITIGRGSDNDIVLDAPQVSRHHARIIRKEKNFFVEDLASANGTFVNGKRVGRAEISSDDTLSFGTYAVRIDLARGALQKSYRGDILLQAENIRVDVKNEGRVKRLLDGISFTAYPTEFVGLMGPSGAGKTTLLMSMIGYLSPTYGRTTLNGDDLATHYDRYRGAIGYVPQEDIIHGELSVYEALYYTAKLRLPQDTSDIEIDRRIQEVLLDLEIADTADVRIGSPERKGISGGQRKRVNLALELLTEPSLLCLDEPTSGLASEDAANVMRLLRKLADQGRTILLTIHQPSLQVYRQLDNVLYLADGEEVYYGPAYPDSMLYFHPELRQGSPEAEEILADPGSCLRPLVDAKRAGEPMETFAARYRQSHYHKEYVEERRKNQSDVNLTGNSERKAPSFKMHQLLVLGRRYMTIKLKDRLGTAILLVQAPVIATFIALVFSGQEVGTPNRMEFMPFALFLLIISAIWFGCSNAAREIVAEQAIYKRERMVNLSIPAYVGSKFAILAGFSFVQCVTLLGIAYLALDMVGNPLVHLLVLWGCALAGTGMGLTLSALVRTTPAALALVPMLLIPQVILGGAIMPIERMETPAWLLSQTTISRWGFEGMLQIENIWDAYELSADEMPEPLGPGLPAPPPPPNPIDRFIGDSETLLVADLGALGGFTFLFLMSTGLTLWSRERFGQ